MSLLREVRDFFRNGRARLTCHGNPWLCCQYIDSPQCNGSHDPHPIGAWYWRQMQEV